MSFLIREAGKRSYSCTPACRQDLHSFLCQGIRATKTVEDGVQPKQYPELYAVAKRQGDLLKKRERAPQGMTGILKRKEDEDDTKINNPLQYFVVLSLIEQ